MQIGDFSNVSKHNQALRSAWKFYFALLLKFVPRIWPFPVRLRLKQGGVVAVNDFMTLFMYKEIFVKGCYDFPRLTNPEPFIVDVGANTGLFIIRMKQLYPRSRIVAYEPSPLNYSQLKNNIKLSGLDGVELIMKGVGGTARKERLYVHRRNIGGHSIYANQAGGTEYIEVDLVDISGLLGGLDGKVCSLLKLDCEGAEYEIIKRINREMAAKIEQILFEPTASMYDVEELIDHLKHTGYRVDRCKGLYLAVHEEDKGSRQSLSAR